MIMKNEASFSEADNLWMNKALDLARKAEGRTSPNPLVGCVIVKDGLLVGSGYHARAGTPHAEVHALAEAGESSEDSVVYVTLEPCSHFGRTPPCAEALIRAGVKRVVVAQQDPNPLVAGRGIQKLQEAGIMVETGLLAEKAGELNEHFVKAITQGLPFVLYKCALTLDGKTAVESGDSKWITSAAAGKFVHGLRNVYDVILVGSNTVLADNPLLTCRGIEGGRDPVRVIVDGSLAIPLSAAVLNTPSAPCILATTLAAGRAKLDNLRARENVRIWQYNTDRHVPLAGLMRDIYKQGWNSVLLESGGILASEMLKEKLLDKILFIYAPKLAGSGPSPLSGLHLARMEQAVKIRKMEMVALAEDISISGYLDYS